MFQWALETFDKVQDQISQHVAPPPTDGPGRFAYNVQRNDEDAAMGCVYEMDPVFTVVNQSKGWYPIHLACQYSQIRLIRLLFTQPGMNVEQADMNGNTPLHHACMGRDMKATETVQMLVKEYGADVCAKNSQGQTPYDLAVINSVRQFLLPIQLQKETQIALDNGGQGLPPGIDLGGLRIKNSTMAPPPMTFGSPPPPAPPQQQPQQPQPSQPHQPHMFDTPTPKTVAAPTPRIASAPASSPAIPQPQQIGGYSRVGSSSAAIFSDKYRADGFHSSSSDVALQQKYGHDPSSIGRTHHHVTAPPPSSGNSSTMGSITSPMNATTPSSSSSRHGGANPFSASSHLGQRYVAYGPAAAAPAPTTGFASPNYSPAVAAAPMQSFSTFTPSPSAGMNDTIPAPAPATAPTTPYMPPPPYQSQPYQATSTPLTNKRPDFISPAAATHGGSPVTPITPGIVISPSSGESAHDLFSAPPSGGGTSVSTENAKELFSATTPSTVAAAPVSGESVQDVFAAPSPSNTITPKKEEEEEEKVSETPENVTATDDLADPTPEANPEPIPEDTAVTETTLVESTQEVVTQHETAAPVEQEEEPTDGGSDDWVEAVDPSSGKTYYYNHVTNETSWENPKASVEATTAESESGNDWEEIVDPSSNTIYYYNKVTQETSWEKPAGSSTVQSETKESGNDEWVEHTDPSSGQTYYYNTTTQETSWEKPITESSSNSQDEPAAATSSEDDWIETMDPSSGQTYYYNQVTQETSWEKPQALAVAATNESETNEPTEPVHDATAAEEPAQEPQKLNEAQTSGDWIESTDPATGNTYYYNQVTQETSWEKPQPQTVSTEDTPLDEEPSSSFPAKTQTDKIVIEEAPKSNQSAVSAEELFGADPLSPEQPVSEQPNEEQGDQPVNTPSEPAETPDAPETKDEKEADEATGDDGEMLDVPLSPENGKPLVAPKVERSEDLFAAIGMPPPPFQSKR